MANQSVTNEKLSITAPYILNILFLLQIGRSSSSSINYKKTIKKTEKNWDMTHQSGNKLREKKSINFFDR
jgi:hypothetical protein